MVVFLAALKFGRQVHSVKKEKRHRTCVKMALLQPRSCYPWSGVFSLTPPNFMCFINSLLMGSPKKITNSPRLQACDCRTPFPHLHRPQSSAVIRRDVRSPRCGFRRTARMELALPETLTSFSLSSSQSPKKKFQDGGQAGCIAQRRCRTR